MSDGRWLYLLADETLDRQAYRLWLEQQLHWPVHRESDLAPTRIWAALRQRPPVALLLSVRPAPRARDALEMIHRVSPATRVLVVCEAADTAALEGWGRCPLHGLIARHSPPRTLAEALDRLESDDDYFPPRIARALEAARRRCEVLPKLSRRERELLPLLASGLTLREAAERMTVSYKTADSYRTSLLRKVGVRDRVALTRWAIRERIIDP